MEARFVYVFVLGILFTGTKDLLRSQIITADAKLKSRGLWEIYSGLVLLVSLLFRPHNLPILCCCLLIQTLMAQFIWKKLQYDAAQTTIMHYWFGQAFFYFQVSKNNHISDNKVLKPLCLFRNILDSRRKRLKFSVLLPSLLESFKSVSPLTTPSSDTRCSSMWLEVWSVAPLATPNSDVTESWCRPVLYQR